MRADAGPQATDDTPFGFATGGSLLARLDTLRRVLVRTALAIGVGFLIAFTFVAHIVTFILRPLQHVLPEGQRLVYLNSADAFILYLWVSAIAGAILASPYLLWQLWRLLVPVVSRRLRRAAVLFVVSSTVLFAIGAAFGHLVVFPWVWRFLASFATDYMRFAPEIGPAFWLYAKIVVALGLVFEMPVVVFFLARLGVVTHRTLIHYGRYAVLVAFVVGAIVTPPDGVSQVLVATPLVALYGLAIGLAWLASPRARPGA
jgi:sec-independent protein translocase protein TatC